MMIVTVRVGLARAGGLETSSHSPATALELPDEPQGRNPAGKRCGSGMAPCLRRVIPPRVWGLRSDPSAWAEPGAAPGAQPAATAVRNPGARSDGLGILWETAHLATGREGAQPVLQTVIATRCRTG